MSKHYDFSGWATRNDLLCADGRTIRKDAFKGCDGLEVPLVWNHQHNAVGNVLGHALLENRDEGVYAYCTFNDSEEGKTAKEYVKHGDIRSLSIYANQLKQMGHDVVHGVIRELSLVLAGANPGATIDFVMAHGEDSDEISGFVADYAEGGLVLYHSECGSGNQNEGKKEDKMDNEKKTSDDSKEKSIQDIIDSMTDEQKTIMYAMVGEALGEGADDNGEDDEDMKHNVFEGDSRQQGNFLSHADEQNIMARAKKLGSFQAAMEEYAEENTLQHGFEDYEQLFPENEWINTPGAPQKIDLDESWVSTVLNKVKKSPISRVRSRYVDLRNANLRALGYTKGEEKKLMGQFSMIGRSTDPQTVYVKEKMERDDIIDITDFDVVDYIKTIMRDKLNLEIATAILIGDGRSEGAEGKIKEEHIRPVWTDADLYTIKADVDIEAARKEVQGTDTSKSFGDNYVYAEAIISASLYAREKYKGSGSLDFFCTPHLLNVMLLARDMNGRRIYDSKADLAAALNVKNIFTVEQFEGKTRKDDENKEHKLLGIFYNLADYQLGSAKGGQITNFEDFDIDFNQYKYLMETRLSGANTQVFSAIVLEEPVTQAAG